jgi:tRNA A-37 threonylcarbamoyl transferase component Bud32
MVDELRLAIGRLTDKERSDLIALAESLVPKEDIHSLCVFGPRVAGYGEEVSVPDLLIVTKDAKGVTMGVEERGPDKPRPVIIGQVTLMAAAERPTMDESVVGRFLNVYEPLLNEEFLLAVENAYKKRVMAEELIEIQADYGDFSSNLILPYEFFLFDKLHKQALDDPDLISTFGRIYSGGQKKENLEFALRGFRTAAESFSMQGIVERMDGSVRTLKGRKKRMDALGQLYKIHPQTFRGSIRYAFHSFVSIAGVEQQAKPFTKLKEIENVRPIPELDRPKKLIRLDEGVIFDDPSKTIEEIALIYGFGSNYAHQEEKKGGVINSSTQLKLSGNGKEMKFILKHFPQLKNAKWVILNVWAFTAKRFNMTPLSRLDREVKAVRRLHQIGIGTHVITGVVLDERTLVSEYTEGVPLEKDVVDVASGKSKDTANIENYARVLAKMHRAGLVYGDTKPANALVGRDGIYLIDLEQAVERGDPSWDLAEFLYYSARLAKQEEGMRLVADSFLSAYMVQNGSHNIAQARKLKYLSPFLMFISPRMSRVIRRSLEKHARTL